MALAEYLVPVQDKANICFSCQKACGGCSWTEVNPDTGKLRFEPVPGWTAKPVLLNVGCSNGHHRKVVETYHITACPEFVADEPRSKKRDYLEVSDEQFALILAKWRREGEI